MACLEVGVLVGRHAGAQLLQAPLLRIAHALALQRLRIGHLLLLRQLLL